MSNAEFIIRLLCFTGGISVGVAIKGYVDKKNFDKQLDDMETTYLKRQFEKAVKDLSEGPKEPTALENVPKPEPITTENEKPTMNHYISYYKGENMKELEDRMADEQFPDDDNPFYGGGKLGPLDDAPYVIDQTEYITNDDYEKVLINYYPAEEVFTTEDDEDIRDPMSLIGPDAVNRFGDDSGDDDIVYIRNEGMNTDYEVIRCEGKRPEWE